MLKWLTEWHWRMRETTPRGPWWKNPIVFVPYHEMIPRGYGIVRKNYMYLDRTCAWLGLNLLIWSVEWVHDAICFKFYPSRWQAMILKAVKDDRSSARRLLEASWSKVER